MSRIRVDRVTDRAGTGGGGGSSSAAPPSSFPGAPGGKGVFMVRYASPN